MITDYYGLYSEKVKADWEERSKKSASNSIPAPYPACYIYSSDLPFFFPDNRLLRFAKGVWHDVAVFSLSALCVGNHSASKKRECSLS
jgi:hypothetical protein